MGLPRVGAGELPGERMALPSVGAGELPGVRMGLPGVGAGEHRGEQKGVLWAVVVLDAFFEKASTVLTP